MSTKMSILLSDDNEHWYHDCSDDTFVLEFDKKHLDNDIDDPCLVIKRGTALYKAIAEYSGIGNRE